jgi:hypothetical protein
MLRKVDALREGGGREMGNNFIERTQILVDALFELNYLNPSTEFGDFLSVLSDLPAILFVGCGPLRPPESRLRPPP